MLIHLNNPVRVGRKHQKTHPGTLSQESVQWLDSQMKDLKDLLRIFPFLSSASENISDKPPDIASEKTVPQVPHGYVEFGGKPSLKIAYPLLSSEKKDDRFLVIHLYGDSKEAWKNLLWKLIFKGITVSEFIIMDELLKKRWGSLSDSAKQVITFFFFLSSSTRKGLRSLKSNLRPIATKIPIEFSKDFYPDSSIQKFLKLPEKGRTPSYLIQYKTLKQIKSQSDFRIGKGYTDQGGISPVSHLSVEILKGYSVPSSGGKFDREFFSILKAMKEKYQKI